VHIETPPQVTAEALSARRSPRRTTFQHADWRGCRRLSQRAPRGRGEDRAVVSDTVSGPDGWHAGWENQKGLAVVSSKTLRTNSSTSSFSRSTPKLMKALLNRKGTSSSSSSNLHLVSTSCNKISNSHSQKI
jgi:hypothetical protein